MIDFTDTICLKILYILKLRWYFFFLELPRILKYWIVISNLVYIVKLRVELSALQFLEGNNTRTNSSTIICIISFAVYIDKKSVKKINNIKITTSPLSI